MQWHSAAQFALPLFVGFAVALDYGRAAPAKNERPRNNNGRDVETAFETAERWK